jgi:hypothetical protein
VAKTLPKRTFFYRTKKGKIDKLILASPSFPLARARCLCWGGEQEASAAKGGLANPGEEWTNANATGALAFFFFLLCCPAQKRHEKMANDLAVSELLEGDGLDEHIRTQLR